MGDASWPFFRRVRQGRSERRFANAWPVKVGSVAVPDVFIGHTISHEAETQFPSAVPTTFTQTA